MSSLRSAADVSSRPLSGIFAINKPSGPTSMSLLEELKFIFARSSLFRNTDGKAPEGGGGGGRSRGRGRGGGRSKGKGGRGGGGLYCPKVGQGGTLDPLADGVLVIGVGDGTKKLQTYLDGTKGYRAIGLLGSATTSYDCKDPILSRASHSHVTEALLSSQLPTFTGSFQQLPPLYSAIRMDGMRLFDYARQGLPLPRPIEKRNVTVSELRLVRWLSAGEHAYKEPEEEVPDEEKHLVGKVKELAGVPEITGVKSACAELPASATESISTSESQTKARIPADPSPPPAFELEMTVSSGTYVRSIVHDLAQACNSAAHVVSLTRTQQGPFTLTSSATGSQGVELPGNCIEWDVFASAIADVKEKEQKNREDGGPRLDYRVVKEGEEGLEEWEKILLSK